MEYIVYEKFKEANPMASDTLIQTLIEKLDNRISLDLRPYLMSPADNTLKETAKFILERDLYELCEEYCVHIPNIKPLVLIDGTKINVTYIEKLY